MVGSLPENKIIWITLINRGFIDFTKNFFESMKKANVRFRLHIYCLDEESFNCFKNYENCICLKTDFISEKKIKKDFVEFGQLEYRKICFAKLDVILFTLKKYPDHSVGYIDTDIVLLSDPTDIFLDLMKKFEDEK